MRSYCIARNARRCVVVAVARRTLAILQWTLAGADATCSPPSRPPPHCTLACADASCSLRSRCPARHAFVRRCAAARRTLALPHCTLACADSIGCVLLAAFPLSRTARKRVPLRSCSPHSRSPRTARLHARTPSDTSCSLRSRCPAQHASACRCAVARRTLAPPALHACMRGCVLPAALPLSRTAHARAVAQLLAALLLSRTTRMGAVRRTCASLYAA